MESRRAGPQDFSEDGTQTKFCQNICQLPTGRHPQAAGLARVSLGAARHSTLQRRHIQCCPSIVWYSTLLLEVIEQAFAIRHKPNRYDFFTVLCGQSPTCSVVDLREEAPRVLCEDPGSPRVYIVLGTDRETVR